MAITWSTFTRYMMDAKPHAPAAAWQAARRDGIDRWAERQRAGRAGGVLDFSDIVARLEAAISGAR